jgi:hypothetical protein
MQKSHNTASKALAFGALGVAAEQTSRPKPETFRLPKIGEDPYFGLTRSWYYAAEKRGVLQLIRLRQRGKLRGVVLVPYDDVGRIVHLAREQETKDIKPLPKETR